MSIRLLNIGFHNVVAAQRVVALVSPDSSPIKRLMEIAKKNGTLIDATCGRKNRSVLVTDSNHVILSALQPEAITHRFSLKERENIKKEI